MPKYNRDFLVPYLQDVCALHLLHRKLLVHRRDLENQVAVLQRGKEAVCPDVPRQEPIVTAGRIIAILIGGFFLWMTLATITEQMGFFFFAFSLILAIPFLWGGISGMRDAQKSNEYKEKEYMLCAQKYEEIVQQNKKGRARIPFLQEEIQRCQGEAKKVNGVLRQVYSANVIPGQYRNLYAAVYLYQYFGQSQADDLDLVLNTFVLEQIKAKLDVVIQQQSEAILNQRIMLANQEKTMEAQQKHAAMLESKLSRMEASDEERNQYLSMIESNIATTAYFATAQYNNSI